jgi:isopenicillin N synthase-like dioxygenase
MSNGVFKSPVHRVVTNAEKERVSMAMFYATDLEKEVQPIAELVDDKHPARYKKIKYRDLMSAHYDSFSRRERVIESLKI